MIDRDEHRGLPLAGEGGGQIGGGYLSAELKEYLASIWGAQRFARSAAAMTRRPMAKAPSTH
jgi:hypothetical protein